MRKKSILLTAGLRFPSKFDPLLDAWCPVCDVELKYKGMGQAKGAWGRMMATKEYECPKCFQRYYYYVRRT